MNRAIARFASSAPTKSKFKGNVKDARLNAAATNSKTNSTPKSRRDAGATLRSRTAGSQDESGCRATHESNGNCKARVATIAPHSQEWLCHEIGLTYFFRWGRMPNRASPYSTG